MTPPTPPVEAPLPLPVPDRPPYLFVYGTLLSAVDHPARRPLLQGATLLGAAWLHGRLYDLGAYPGLVPDPAAEPVRGELYHIHDAAVWPELDRYEGFGTDAAAPDEPRDQVRDMYLPLALPVHAADGTPGGSLIAVVYVYNWPLGAATRIASGDYLAYRGIKART